MLCAVQIFMVVAYTGGAIWYAWLFWQIWKGKW